MDSNPSSEDRMLDILEAYDRALAAGRSATTVDDRAVPEDLKPQVKGVRVCLELLEAAFPRGQRQTLSANGIDYITTGNRPQRLPERIGRYTILKELGRGGMGVVYLADDPDLRRQVAVKVVKDSEFASSQEFARFRTEAQAVARLDHPHVVKIHDIDEDNGRPFFVLEYMPGGNLGKLIAGKPQPPRLAAELLQMLARTIHHVHEMGIIHRDLKPGNILLGDRQSAVGDRPTGNSTLSSGESVAESRQPMAVKIADFGLAKELDANATRTHSGVIMGTPPYMAPEQAYGLPKATTPQTDIYALGAILYELLTGCPPFQGGSKEAILEQVRLRDPVPPRRREPSVPRDLEKICLKCLYKDPKDRYASAEALAEDLRRWLAGDLVKPTPEPRLTRLARMLKHHHTACAAFAVVLAFMTFLTAAMVIWPREYHELPPSETDHVRVQMQSIKEELVQGRRVDLIGPTGGAVCSSIKFGVAQISSIETSPLLITSVTPVLLELLDDPKIDRYRFRAELLSAGDGNSEAGIYFSHQHRDTDQGREHWFWSIRYHDVTNKGWVRISASRYAQFDLNHARFLSDNNTIIGSSFHGGSGAIQWRTLTALVHPQGITARWDDENLGEAGLTELAKTEHLMMNQHPRAAGPPPKAYSPSGSLGLFLRNGSINVRNVWIEPLP